MPADARRPVGVQGAPLRVLGHPAFLDGAPDNPVHSGQVFPNKTDGASGSTTRRTAAAFTFAGRRVITSWLELNRRPLRCGLASTAVGRDWRPAA